MLIHKPLYHIAKGFMNGTRYFMQKLWWEPLFKSQCESCGSGLRLLIGMPLISSNLRMRFGNNVSINGMNTFSATTVHDNPVMEVGDGSVLSHLLTISAGERVTIGKNCLVGERTFITDNNGHPIPPNRRREKVRPEEIKPVTIGDGVWIAHNVFIGPGVTIGNNSIIGFNSVVVKDIPENCIAAGVPAKVIRYFDKEEIELLD